VPLGAKATATAGRVGRNPAAKAIGRLGLVARGVVYCIVAGLAVRIASGEFERADKRGALETIVRQPSGRVMLVVLAIGFTAYAASCFVKAAAGAAEGASPETGAGGAATRLVDVSKGAIYLVLVGTTLAVALKDNRGGPGDESEQEWTAEVLRHQWGQPLVALVGVALVGTGLYLLYRGISQSFEENLRIDEMPPWARRPMSLLGTAGYVARGVIFGLIGVFVFIAAVGFDAEESVGVDGALKKLAEQSYGPAILVLVALGLFCFGLFSFVEARYRKVLQA
jgi:hypothetical protein